MHIFHKRYRNGRSHRLNLARHAVQCRYGCARLSPIFFSFVKNIQCQKRYRYYYSCYSATTIVPNGSAPVLSSVLFNKPSKRYDGPLNTSYPWFQINFFRSPISMVATQWMYYSNQFWIVTKWWRNIWALEK